jgi:hypothetical protein
MVCHLGYLLIQNLPSTLSEFSYFYVNQKMLPKSYLQNRNLNNNTFPTWSYDYVPEDFSQLPSPDRDCAYANASLFAMGRYLHIPRACCSYDNTVFGIRCSPGARITEM